MSFQIPSLPFTLNLNNTFGVAMICAFFAAMYVPSLQIVMQGITHLCSLYGVMCLQCYIFFNRFSQEGLRLKCSVWALWYALKIIK